MERNIQELFDIAAKEISEENGIDKAVVDNTMVKLIYQIVRI